MPFRQSLSPTARRPPTAAGLAVCAVAAAAQIVWAGYAFGVGNQSVQIPFFLRLRNPALFERDDLMSVLPSYPGVVYPLLARMIPETVPAEIAFAVLHFMVATLTLAGASALAAGLAGRRRAGLWMLLLLVAGHHRGLGESGLYALAFTPTGLAVAVGAAALALAVRSHPRSAFLVAGLLLHLHALHGAFVGFLLGVWSLAAAPRLGWRRIAQSWLLGGVIALPALAPLVRGAGAFDDEWVRLLRLRSAHHVFPSAWWRAGDPQIARLSVLIGFAALAFGVRPARRPREFGALLAGPLLLALAGLLFTEVWPTPFVMRLQLFRASVFFALLLLAQIAGGLDAAARLVWRGISRRRAGALIPAAILVGAAGGLALPALAPLGPALALAAALALLRPGRLSRVGAAGAAFAVIVAALSFVRLRTPLAAGLRNVFANSAGEAPPAATAAALALALVVLLGRSRRRWIAVAVGIPLAAAIALQTPGTAGNPSSLADAWADIQLLAARLTPPDALILTPTVPGGFRIRSARAVVAEWRDGTLQFFDPAFARRWADRIRRIRGSDDTLDSGRDLADQPDEELLAIAREYGATHLVLPADRRPGFIEIARNARWALYRAEPRPPPPAPPGFASPEIWAEQERFLQKTILPNVERHRKSSATLRVRDDDGQPVSDAPFRIELVRHRFGFGSSLPHFARPAGASRGFQPPLVDPRQLPLFLDLFNYSVTSFSGKWDCLEPVRGKPDYGALDAYMDWCAANGVAVEFHFVTGYPPAWLRELPPDGQREELLRHANALIDRYGNRVAAWQIVNERQLMAFAPDVFRLFRERLPGVPLGVSNCAKFYSERAGEEARQTELLNGWRDIEWLRDQGIATDYFGYHGHRPFGLWADLRSVYEAFDHFERHGVRIRVTEFGVAPRGPIVGGVRRGAWTPELHAEYYRLMYLTAFSHPNVDAINIWGIEPRTWMPGAGLLDEEFRPKPVYEALRKLIREELSTKVAGRLPLDGAIRFRGFHGRYRMELDTPEGTAHGEFDLAPDAPADFRVEWIRGRPALSIGALPAGAPTAP